MPYKGREKRGKGKGQKGLIVSGHKKPRPCISRGLCCYFFLSISHHHCFVTILTTAVTPATKTRTYPRYFISSSILTSPPVVGIISLGFDRDAFSLKFRYTGSKPPAPEAIQLRKGSTSARVEPFTICK